VFHGPLKFIGKDTSKKSSLEKRKMKTNMKKKYLFDFPLYFFMILLYIHGEGYVVHQGPTKHDSFSSVTLTSWQRHTS